GAEAGARNRVADGARSGRWAGREVDTAVEQSWQDVAALLQSGRPLNLAELQIDGHALVRAGFQAGPALGALLRELLVQAAAGSVENEPDALLALARRL